MSDTNSIPRILLGGLAICAGLAIAFFALSFMGAMMRVGVVGSTTRILLLVLVGSLAIPPIMVGVHTILFRPRKDAVVNDHFLRGVALVSFAGVATQIYAGSVLGATTGLVPIVAIIIISGACIAILRRAPGGVLGPKGERPFQG